MKNSINMLKQNRQYFCIVPAAGSSRRMQQQTPKQYLPLAQGICVLEAALQPFLESSTITHIIVVLHEDDQYFKQLAISKHPKISHSIGGELRLHSVLNGLQALAHYARAEDWILVHDAARPCLSAADLRTLMHELGNHEVGGLLATPLRDTLKSINKTDETIISTLDRENLYSALTPQMFKYKLLTGALRNILQQDDKQLAAYTDDASVIEALGLIPKIVLGHASNIKLTYDSDLPLIKAIYTTLQGLTSV